MINLTPARAKLHSDLGYKPLNRTWAKLEILIGLVANGLGVLVMLYWMVVGQGLMTDWILPGGGLGLFVFGAYLAMAGHRSHLYQSSNDRTAYLLEQIQHLRDKD